LNGWLIVQIKQFGNSFLVSSYMERAPTHRDVKNGNTVALIQKMELMDGVKI